MADPDITLTDFALATLCAGFALALLGGGPVALLYAGLFAALAAAALAGALWHGWWPGAQTGAGSLAWLAVMVSVGVANLFLWLLSATLSGRDLLGWIGWATLAAYLAIAFFASRSFLVASGFSLPPTLALLTVYLLHLAAPGYGLGALALGIALAGAGMQAAKIGLPALRLSPNGLYHVVQALAFTLLFIARPGA